MRLPPLVSTLCVVVLASPSGLAFAQAAKGQTAAPTATKTAAKATPPTTPKAASYIIHQITFQGSTPYTSAALESAAGLKVGSALSDAGLQEAAERLVATGAFADVGASLDGPFKAIKVIFKVQAVGPEHMLRASFDNFIWFTHEELIAGIQSRVPLFNGSIPEGGTVQGAVEDALKQMLQAKGVNAKVSSQLAAPGPGQPFRMAEYRVEEPSILIRQLDVSGLPPRFELSTDKVVRKLMGSPYNDGLVNSLSDRILEDYRNAGYQEAKLVELKSTIVSSTPTQVQIDLTTALQPGEVYQLSKLVWAGSPQMSAEAFAAAAKLHPGDVASQEKLQESLESLDAAYRKQGYVDVILDVAPKLDTAAHQVSYTVTATPGPQYKLRKLTVQGLSPAQRKQFDSVWKLKAGDVYDAGYVKGFLSNKTALPTLAGLSASFKANEDPEAALLDLDVSFFKEPGK